MRVRVAMPMMTPAMSARRSNRRCSAQ
jgi:hypothetical protein